MSPAPAARLCGLDVAASHVVHTLERQLIELKRECFHHRAAARTLQAAMVTQLPAAGQLQMAAGYLTGVAGNQVGGDWYDAIVTPSQHTTLVIGDVMGHDLTAAAVMGQLRVMLRTLVSDRLESPSATVRRLDRTMRDLRVDTIATLILATVEAAPDRSSGERIVRWSNAGHPAPLLLLADGTALTLDATSDLLLGVSPETARRDLSYSVPPGATLLLYTDGLVETCLQDVDAGQRQLRAALRTHHRLGPSELVDALLAAMITEKNIDDVTMLAVRFP